MARKRRTPQQQATSQVNQILAPLLAQTQQRQERTVPNLAGIYEAVAKAQEPVAGQISQDYQQFGQLVGGVSKGYSDGLRAALGESAGEANRILEGQGSPQTVDSGAGAADVLFGLTGSIPTQQLASEGAAFTAAARQLPGQARTLGAQAQAGATAGFEDQIREIEAKRPELYQQMLNEIRQFEQQQAELTLKELVAESEFGLKTRKQGFSEAATTERLQQGRQRLGQSAQRLALDEAKANLGFGLKQANLRLSKGRLKLAQQKEARFAKAPKKGGFSATAKQRFRGMAHERAEWVFDTDQPLVLALRRALNDGVPFSIAIEVFYNFARTNKRTDWLDALDHWTKKK